MCSTAFASDAAAHWIGKPVAIGGLGVGSRSVGLVLAVTLCGFIAYLAATKVDTPDGRTSSDVSGACSRDNSTVSS